ncbi:MAG: DPP IV N-terminal domain-containing protein, partial [Gramella sp.]|nr:DPP IV N-terminal domain-containing protein [Christiangramia sp.]
MIRNLTTIVFFLTAGLCSFSQSSDLSVEKIMQDTNWMGTFPSDVKWGPHSENIYFDYNPENNPADSLHRINLKNLDSIVRVSAKEKKEIIPNNGDFNSSRSMMIFSQDGDLYIYDLRSRKKEELLDLNFSIQNPEFLMDDEKISFAGENNIFLYDLKNGKIKQLTNFKSGSEKGEKEDEVSAREQWLKSENLDLLKVVKQRKENKEKGKAYREAMENEEEFTFHLAGKDLRNLNLSPNAEYAGFSLIKRESNKETIVPDYVDESGYTVDLSARSKVGDIGFTAELGLYDLKRDTVIMIDLSGLPGIKDLPDFTSDYPDKEWEEKEREIIPSRIYFSENGNKAVVN